MRTRHPLSLPPIIRLSAAVERATNWTLLRYDETGEYLPTSRRNHAVGPRIGVFVDREIVGYLGLAPLPGSDEEAYAAPVELARSLAELIGSWIAALQVARDNDEELASLVEITRLLTSAASRDQLLTILCEAAAAEIEAEVVFLSLLDESEQTLSVKATYPENLLFESAIHDWRAPLADSAADQEALAGAPLVIPCPRDDIRCQHWPEELRNLEGTAICVGMIARDRALGTMVVVTDEFQEVSLHALRVLQAIAHHGAICIDQAKLEKDSQIKKVLTRDMASASEIQKALLPHKVPRFPNLELAVHREYCQAIGGDLYDFIHVDDDRLGLAIGDACGKSITGALMMATVRGGLHAYVRDVYDISEIMKRLNVTINQATLGEYFMTLFYGVLNTKTLEFTYINGGHNSPLWFHKDRCVQLEGGGTLLGADPQCEYHVSKIQLAPGDSIVFYTDGLAEAMDEAGQLFRESRIQTTAHRDRGTSAQDILDGLLDAVTDFRGAYPLRDDLTIVVLKVPENTQS